MSRNWRLFAIDMREACEKINRYVAGKSFDDFMQNDMAYDAVLRNLEIIGEAAKKVPPEIRREYSQVEWKSIAGLRDILAHAYFALDAPTLWDIVTNEIPALHK